MYREIEEESGILWVPLKTFGEWKFRPVASFQKELAKLENKLANGADFLQQQWNALEASRAAQGYAVSTLRYTSNGENE